MTGRRLIDSMRYAPFIKDGSIRGNEFELTRQGFIRKAEAQRETRTVELTGELGHIRRKTVVQPNNASVGHLHTFRRESISFSVRIDLGASAI